MRRFAQLTIGYMPSVSCLWLGAMQPEELSEQMWRRVLLDALKQLPQ